MKNFFKPEDFDLYSSFLGLISPGVAAKFANEKLQKLIESSPVVYSAFTEDTWHTSPIIGGKTGREDISQKKARLVFIEEIKKECLKHEPILWTGIGHPYIEYKCKHCGVELQATWSEVKI